MAESTVEFVGKDPEEIVRALWSFIQTLTPRNMKATLVVWENEGEKPQTAVATTASKAEAALVMMQLASYMSLKVIESSGAATGRPRDGG